MIQHSELMTTCFQTRREEASPMVETEETKNSCIAKERSIYGYNECPIDTFTESKGRTGWKLSRQRDMHSGDS